MLMRINFFFNRVEPFNRSKHTCSMNSHPLTSYKRCVENTKCVTDMKVNKTHTLHPKTEGRPIRKIDKF